MLYPLSYGDGSDQNTRRVAVSRARRLWGAKIAILNVYLMRYTSDFSKTHPQDFAWFTQDSMIASSSIPASDPIPKTWTKRATSGVGSCTDGMRTGLRQNLRSLPRWLFFLHRLRPLPLPMLLNTGRQKRAHRPRRP